MDVITPLTFRDVVGLLFIVIGWIIVHSLSVRREINKELRQLAYQLLVDLDQLERLAIDYHCAIIRSINEERTVKKAIESIRKALSRVGLQKTKKQQDAFRKMRLAIAGENFEDESFQSQSDESALLRDIAYYISEVNCLVDSYIVESCRASLWSQIKRWRSEKF